MRMNIRFSMGSEGNFPPMPPVTADVLTGELGNLTGELGDLTGES